MNLITRRSSKIKDWKAHRSEGLLEEQRLRKDDQAKSKTQQLISVRDQ